MEQEYIVVDSDNKWLATFSGDISEQEALEGLEEQAKESEAGTVYLYKATEIKRINK